MPSRRGPSAAAIELGRALRARREVLPATRPQAAEALGCSTDRVRQVETGRYPPGVDYMARWVKVYGPLDDELRALWRRLEDERTATREATRATDGIDLAGGIAVEDTDYALVALEIARRSEASDLGAGTVEAVTLLVDHLCRAYASTRPDELRRKVVRHLWYVGRLLERRLSLDQRRELLIASGWLALLGACAHFDLRDRAAAEASRTAAFHLGQQTGHRELVARALETKAWFALSEGAADAALALVRQGQGLVEPGTGASLQLGVQEARAWARLGDRAEVRRTIDDAARELAAMAVPEHPEHHFVFDATKFVSYAASSFAWVGEGGLAEEHAREVIAQCERDGARLRWPRRRASAQVDLGLALAQLDRPDEAAHVGCLAVESRWLVPSNQWRAAELDRALTTRFGGVAEVEEFHERFQAMRRTTEAELA